MTEDRTHEELTEEEVEEAHAERLPNREAMTVMRPPLPMADLPPGFTIDPPVSDA